MIKILLQLVLIAIIAILSPMLIGILINNFYVYFMSCAVIIGAYLLYVLGACIYALFHAKQDCPLILN